MKIAVTGANAGIGLRATTLLAERGHEVVAFVRDVERGEGAIRGLTPAIRKHVSVRPLDLASRRSIRAAADQLVGEGRLDGLINNAAIFDQTVRAIRTTTDGHELFWATNHLGPTELTARLTPALTAAPAPAIVFVASKGLVAMPRIRIRFDALDGAGWFSPTRAYYHAKLAQVMTAVSVAERSPRSWRVSCLRVLAVRLDADRLASQPAILRALYAPKDRLAASPEAIAGIYVELVERGDPPDAVYLDEALRPVRPPAFARDSREREKLWGVTQAEIGHPIWQWEPN